MSSLNMEFGFNVPKSVIYEALTHPLKIMQYTRAPAQVEPKEGGEFVILEGKIRGRFLKLRENEYIKMEWRLSEWKEPSTVQIIFKDEEEEDECEIYLSQVGIPQGEKKQKLEFGWKQYYFEAMSKILGYALKN